MKIIGFYLFAGLILVAGSSFQIASAQEKSKEQLEQEYKIQQAIDAQKKAMAEQQKAMDEAQKAIQEQQHALQDSLFNLRIDKRAPGTGMDVYRYYNDRGNRAIGINEPFLITPGVEGFWGHGGDSQRTTWDFSKSVKENTFSKEYSFDVEKTVNTVVMSVMGDCKKGEIRIRIIMPGGKSFSDILIDESGNLNWRKSFTISEKENQDKTGEWKFKIDSKEATGFFKISLQSY